MTSPEDEPADGAEITVDPTLRRALITWAAGVPVFNPWMATIDALLANADFKPDFAVISDWRNASGMPDQAFVDSFLVFCQSVRRARRLSGRWAIVVAQDFDSGSGVGRSAELEAHGTADARVFKGIEDAIEWVSQR
jgi:hypothetical protein